MSLLVLKHPLILGILAIILCYLLFGTIGHIPRRYATEYPRDASSAVPPDRNSPLRRALLPHMQAHPGQSGFTLILKDPEALRTRLEMIEAAEHSLDLQYYIIQNDSTNRLLVQALLKAAERGVRIRILVDDISVKKSDKLWALLNETHHIELRLFNPFSTRDQPVFSRIVNLFSGLERYMRRMHNKLFVVDNQLALVGGRNLGDAYFGINKDFNFRDLDLLCAGPVVPQMSRNFDSFWNGKEAYPFAAVTHAAISATQAKHLREELDKHWQDMQHENEYLPAMPLTEQVQKNQIALIWADAEVHADSPSKVEPTKTLKGSKPVKSLQFLLDNARHEFVAVSPYFVPGKNGIALLKTLSKRGVKVKILTNSLGSTDVVAVHTGYKRYRADALATGAQLYELKPLPGRHSRPGRFASSSRASLHTKAYIVDGEDVVVGTFNWDPRSIHLNTEMALVVHSPELAAQLLFMFKQATLPSTSFHLTLDSAESTPHIVWTGEDKGRQVQYRHEPKAGFWRSLKSCLISLVPGEGQL